MTSTNISSVAVSIILECDTCMLTTRYQLERSVRTATARGAETGMPFEVILVSRDNVEKLPALNGVSVVGGVAGYYRQKSVGASLARGEFVAFWDSDCEPTPGYLKIALERLAADSTINGLAGVTTYAGTSSMSQLNTIFSFGYLHDPGLYPERLPALAHNLVARRNRLPPTAFGPYVARYGGDRFVTDALSAQAGLLPVDSRLQMKHEDISFSLRLTLERHFREHFGTRLADRLSPSELRDHAIASVRASATRRLRRFNRFIELRRPAPSGTHLWLSAHALIYIYLLIDLLAVWVLTTIRPWFRRWLHYQFEREFRA